MDTFIIISSEKAGELLWGFSSQDLSSMVSGISALVSIIAVIFGVFKYFDGVSKNKALEIKKENLKLNSDINKKIEVFYGPCLALREQSRILYSVFAIDLKKNSSVRFRTLRYLCSYGVDNLSTADSSILKEIMSISRKNLELIEANSWLITNTALNSLLGKLCAHFRILELAYKGELNGKAHLMENIVFPLEVDGAIYSEVKRLKSLLNHEDKVSVSINQTISYYNQNYEKYYDETAYVDLSDIYKKFLYMIPSNGVILDAGCGVGRDTKYFIQHGYRVHSFDLSEKMVMLCNQYPFAFCEVQSFLNISFYEEFDAVWANASLLHLNDIDFEQSLTNLVKSIKPRGVLFFSLKEKNDSKKFNFINGRDFYYYGNDYILDLLCNKLGMKNDSIWKTHKSKKDTFVNFLFIKS